LNLQGVTLHLPNYIRLGKFNSKARVEWEHLTLESEHPEEREEILDFLLNAVDLPAPLVTKMRAFSVYNIYPAPLLSRCHLAGAFWHCKPKARFKSKAKDLTVCKPKVAKDLPGRYGRKNVSPDPQGRNQWFILILAQRANEFSGSATCWPMRERREQSVR
jgi:hypothetical protein